MTFTTGLLLIALAVWFGGLWMRGFFGSTTPPIDRKVYWSRTAIWLASMLIVGVPLRQFRDSLGTPLYLTIALVILGLFYWLGLVIAKVLVRRYESAESGGP